MKYLISAAMALLLASPVAVFAQNDIAQGEPKPKVVMTKLFPPTYPTWGRAMRTGGDVTVQVSIKPNGSIESVVLFDGSPMLAAAAVLSAKQSTYECRGCGDSGATDLITYTFAIAGDCHFGPHCESLEDRTPRIEQYEGRVWIEDFPLCTCEPTAAVIKVRARALKCLYLWPCKTLSTETR